jgi:hypothetical protein
MGAPVSRAAIEKTCFKLKQFGRTQASRTIA